MTVGAHLFWRLLPDVRAGERTRFVFFAGLLTLVAAGQTVGLAGSEALFLSKVGIDQLPVAFIAAALLTVVGSMLYASLVGSARNDTLYWQMLLGAGALLLGAGALVVLDVAWVYWAAYCFWYLSMAVALNHFWTFSGDYFDTLASKRLVPLFTLGTSVGGVLGGLLAVALARSIGPAALIGAWGATLIGAGILLILGRKALRGWGLLQLEEADETSIESLRGAARYARTSPLARWLTVSALGMVVAAYFAQYLASEIFTRNYPEPDRLASFLSVYFAVTNVIEIFVGLKVAPWLIRKIGVGGANLAHPVFLLGAFGWVANSAALPAGMAARAAQELVDNALAAPVRSLMQNAMPARFRGRVRAFLEGIVVYAGMAVAGVVLLALVEPDPLWLCGVGGAAALFYLYANWRARREYVATLVEQMREGRFDVEDVEGAIGSWESARLVALFEEALAGDRGRPAAALLPLIPVLAQRGFAEPLVRAASHPVASVRRACIDALAQMRDTHLAGTLALSLDDPQPEVRLAALRGLASLTLQGDFLRSRAAHLEADPDPKVRADACLLSGDAGREILAKMLRSGSVAEAGAALAIAPPTLLDAVIECSGHTRPEIRAAALARLSEISDEPPIGEDALFAALTDPHAEVRRAAVLLAARSSRPETVALLGARLADPTLVVRATTERELAKLGEPGVAVAEPRLRDDFELPALAALRVVANSGARHARAFLQRELRYRAAQTWWYLLAQLHLPQGDSLPERFLRAALFDAVVRERRLAFRILRLLENESVIRKVERELAPHSRVRANALELLSNVGDREAAARLAALHESGPAEERARAAASDLDLPEGTPALLAACRTGDNPWLRMAARALAPEEGDPAPKEETMERLLALKQIDLFANLSLEQVDAILEASEDVEYMPGEVILREGDPGDALFLLLEGSVDIVLGRGTPNERKKDPMRAVAYLGEMAILTNEPRTATAVAATHCEMLKLDGAAFRDLVRQVPDISFEIFRVLTHRLREAEKARAH